MTSYSTCINCAADKTNCPRRRAVQEAIKGAGITSLKFRCSERKPMFRPGQRVSVTWAVGGDNEYALDETWPATVIKESGTRFLLSVDDVESDEGTPAKEFINNERLFVKVSPSRLTLLNEPERAICRFCDRAPLAGSDCPERSAEWFHTTGNCPPGCMLAQEAA